MSLYNESGAARITTDFDLYAKAGFRLFLEAAGGGWSRPHSIYTTTPMTYAASTTQFIWAGAVWAPTTGAGEFVGLSLEPTINQTGTATGNYTGLRVNVTETAATGTNKLLLDVQRNGTSRMAVTSAGNVGIGTTSPQSKLDVAGGVRLGTDTTCSAAKAGMLAWNANALQICLSSGSWATLSSSSGTLTAAGTNRQIQFNDGGALAGDSGLTWNKTNATLRIAGTAPLNLNDRVYQYVADFDLSIATSRPST